MASQSGQVSWTNAYSGQQLLEKPKPQPVLLRESGSAGKTSKTSFCRNFKDWKRSGVLVPGDIGLWDEGSGQQLLRCRDHVNEVHEKRPQRARDEDDQLHSVCDS